MIQSYMRNLIIILLLFFVFFTYIGIYWMINKISNKYVCKFLSLFITVTMIFYCFHNSVTGSGFISHVMLAVIMCASTRILHFIPYNAFDYGFMFSLFLFMESYYYYPLSASITRALMILTALLFISKIRLGAIKGHIFHIWLNFIIIFISNIPVSYCFDRVVRQIGYLFQSPFIKIVIWSLSTMFLILISVLVIHAITYLCHDYFREINDMGKKYESIERYFITLSIGILLCFLSVSFASNLLYDYEVRTQNLLSVMYIFSLFLQLFFLTLMFRVSYLRESLYEKEIETLSLMTYSSDLERNFSELRDIKHDVKNLFFTMGSYVERSNDQEFKDFYKEKINPFSAGEIQKNDLYAKLFLIEHEQIRAFLYYKLSQALELGIDVYIDIQTKESMFTFNMEFSDMVRILGILIDNAIEESMLFPLGERNFKLQMTQNSDMTSIKIQNMVLEEKLRMGIKPGVSTKGDNRGQGLRIVDEIISNYDFITLNSYFQNGDFVQNLLIYKGAVAPN